MSGRHEVALYAHKGLRWEICARLGKPHSLKEARELALEVEREYACSVLDEEDEKVEIRGRIKKVNIVNQDIEQITCAYCKRVGHGSVNCVISAKYYGQQRVSQNNFNGQSGFNSNNFNGQSGFNSNNFNGQSGFNSNYFNGQNRSGQNSGQNNGQNIPSRNFSGSGNNS